MNSKAMDNRSFNSQDSIHVLPYVDGPLRNRSLKDKLALGTICSSSCGKCAFQSAFVLFLLVLTCLLALSSPTVVETLDSQVWQNDMFEGQLPDISNLTFSSCEQYDRFAFVAQPINAGSTAAYFFAGLIMVAFSIADTFARETTNIEDAMLLRRPIWSLYLGLPTILLGCSGFFFHASLTYLSERVDLMAWWLLAATFCVFSLFRLLSSILVVESTIVTEQNREEDDGRSVISDHVRSLPQSSSRRLLAQGSQISIISNDVERQGVSTMVQTDPGCIFNVCGVRASCRFGGRISGWIGDLFSLAALVGAGFGVYFFVTYVHFDMREEAIFVLLVLFFFTTTMSHWCLHRRLVTYSWSFLILAIILFSVGFALNIYEDTEVLCAPNSWFQAHALWHILSGISILLVYLYFRGDEISPPDPYKDGGSDERFLVVVNNRSHNSNSQLNINTIGSVASQSTDHSRRSKQSEKVAKRAVSLRKLKQRQQEAIQQKYHNRNRDGVNMIPSTSASTLSSSSMDDVMSSVSHSMAFDTNEPVRHSSDLPVTPVFSRRADSTPPPMPPRSAPPQETGITSPPPTTPPPQEALPIAVPDDTPVSTDDRSSVASESRPPSLPVIMEYRGNTEGHLLSLVRQGNLDRSLTDPDMMGNSARYSQSNDSSSISADEYVDEQDSDDSEPRTNYESKFASKSSTLERLRKSQKTTRVGDCTLCFLPVHDREAARDAEGNLYHGGCLKCTTCKDDLTNKPAITDEDEYGVKTLYCQTHGTDRSSRRSNVIVRGASAASLTHRDSVRLSVSVADRKKEIVDRLSMSVGEAPVCGRCGGELLDGRDIIVNGMERYHKICPKSTNLQRVPRYFVRRAMSLVAVSFSCDMASNKTYTFLFALDTLTKERALREHRKHLAVLGYEPDTNARAKTKRKLVVPKQENESFKMTEQSGHFKAFGGKHNEPTYNPTSKNVCGTLYHVEGGVRQTLTVWIRYDLENETVEAVSAKIDIRLIPHKPDTAVQAKIKGWKRYYPGAIHSYDEDHGTYSIMFDDGDFVQGVKESQIKVLKST